MIANTELIDGNEEKVDSAGKPYFALQAANTFACARSESVRRFPSGKSERDCVREASGISGGGPWVPICGSLTRMRC